MRIYGYVREAPLSKGKLQQLQSPAQLGWMDIKQSLLTSSVSIVWACGGCRMLQLSNHLPVRPRDLYSVFPLSGWFIWPFIEVINSLRLAVYAFQSLMSLLSPLTDITVGWFLWPFIDFINSLIFAVYAFQSLMSLLSPAYWTSAFEVNGAFNGYTLTDGMYTSAQEVSFASGMFKNWNLTNKML